MYICFLRSLHAFLSADYKKIIETIEAVKYSSYSVPSSWWWWHLWCWPAHSPLHSGSPGAGFPKCSTLCPPPPFTRACEKIAQHNLAKRCWAGGGGALRGSTGPGRQGTLAKGLPAASSHAILMCPSESAGLELCRPVHWPRGGVQKQRGQPRVWAKCESAPIWPVNR